MEKETEIIKLFCDTKDTKYLNELKDSTKQSLIYEAYTCLVQKYGNQELSKLILEYFGEIIQVKTDTDNYIVYTGTHNLPTYESLRRVGVAVIRIIPPTLLDNIRKDFLDTLRQFPEYVRNPQNPDQDITGNPLVYSR